MRRVLLTLVFFGGLLSPVLGLTSSLVGEQSLQALLQKPSLQRQFGVKFRELKLVREFYKARLYEPVWSDSSQQFDQSKIRSVRRVIQNSEADGFSPERYDIELWGSSSSDLSNSQALAREVLLTDRLFHFAKHAAWGRVEARRLYKDWSSQERSPHLVEWMTQAFASRHMGKSLEELFPQTEAYDNLKRMTAMVKESLISSQWPKVKPVGRKWEPGDRGAHIVSLRQRLQSSGHLKASRKIEDPQHYDDDLVKAVKRFQKQHGLNNDGVIGYRTWQALNTSAQDRLQQLLVNLERHRWMPEKLGDRFLKANIPDYRVSLIEKGKVKKTFKTVVGQSKWKTPVFQDELEFMVLNPTWNVPPKITRKETLPKVQEDPSYATRNGFKVFRRNEKGGLQKVDPSTVDWSNAQAKDYFFSQKSGRGNALGRIKFMFPNRYSVYMHDTPYKHRFKSDIRAFSHGCVRVNNPLDLAVAILSSEDSSWNKERLETMLRPGKERTVKLKEPVPVHLVYETAWVDAEGQLQFRHDIYGYDRKLAKALGL